MCETGEELSPGSPVRRHSLLPARPPRPARRPPVTDFTSAVPYPALQLDGAGRVTALNAPAADALPCDPVGQTVSSLFDGAGAVPDSPAALRDWLGEGRALAMRGADARYLVRAQAWDGGGLVVLVDLGTIGPREVDVDLLAKAVDAANNAIVIADLREPDAPLVYANDWFLEFTGYTMDEVMGRNCRFLQVRNGERDDAGDGQEEALDEIRRAIHEAEPVGGVVLRNYTKGGELFYNELYLTPIRGEDGEVTHMIGVQNDVTPRIEAQREREREAERLRGLFGSTTVPLGLLERRPDGALVHVLRNEAAEAELVQADDGRAEADATGTPWDTVATTVERTGAPVRFDVDRGGRTYEVLLSPVAADAPDGPARFLYVALDVTDGRDATEDLLHVSNRQLRRIAQDVHDGVGQLLVGASMMATALAADLADGPHADAAGRLRELVLRSVARLRSFALGLDPVDLDRIGPGEALARLAADAQDVLNVEVTVADQTQGVALSDEVTLDVYRVAQEALTNAVRHGQARTVRVALGRTAAGGLLLTVQDDGHGISAGAADGDGMGLRTMRARARRHGGTLDVRQADVGGTRVRLELPPEQLA